MLRTSLVVALLISAALVARPVSAQRLEIELDGIEQVPSVHLPSLYRAEDREAERLRLEILEIDTTPHVIAALFGLGGLLAGFGTAVGGFSAPCDETNMGLLPGCDGPAALVAGGAILGLAGLVTLIVGITSWHDASVRRNELRRRLDQTGSVRFDGSSISVRF